jgi:cytochrome c oxidase assembly protein subunit 15
VLTFLWRRQVGVSLGLPMTLVLLVIFQGLLGMWTVTLLLKPLIVTLHLIFGLVTLSLLWWLWLSLRRRSSGPWAGNVSSMGGGLTSALVRQPVACLRRWRCNHARRLTSTNYSAWAVSRAPGRRRRADFGCVRVQRWAETGRVLQQRHAAIHFGCRAACA